MTTFKFNKPISEIEDPELLPKDWYRMRISTKPEIQENAKKTGENLFMRLKVVMPEDEMFDGRELPLWLSMPTAEDEENYDNKGVKIADAKMKRIVQFAEASGGVADEDEFDIQEGATVFCYVGKQLDRSGLEMENSIDIFSGFKSEEDLEPEEEEASGLPSSVEYTD
jgi:hypothetical protein